MRCDRAQRELSAAMHEPAPAREDVRRHAESCRVCAAYARELHRLHQIARLEPAPPVPDLVPAIMAKVRAERGVVPVAPVVPLDHGRHRRLLPSAGRRAAAAALVAGIVVGFVLGAGGLFPSGGGGSEALATEIPQRLVHAAAQVRGYHATFDVTERNWSPRVPVRTFRAELWFRAPESFKVVVHDTSTYPSAAWPRNDLELVTDGRSWRATGPNPCPPAELPACHPDAIDKSVVNRAPFDDQSPMPTDVIVPMTVLAAQHRVRVIGPDTVNGRAAEAVSLSYEDATPLFQYLRFLGSWRPFYPQDFVVIDLDRSTWFPLRYEVFPAAGAERTLWASQFGVAGDRAGRPVFSATVRSISTDVPARSEFRVARGPGEIDEGFVDEPITRVPTDMQLVAKDRLRLTRFGRLAASAGRPFRQQVAAYATGLAWATVTKVSDWRQRRLFGVGEFSEPVDLSGRGVGYYEPATSTEPRRIALHTNAAEYVLDTNLSRERLLEMASQLEIRSMPAPRSWFVHRWSGGVVRSGLTPEQAIEHAGFRLALPRSLPSGYRPAVAETVDSPQVRGVTIVYRRSAAELGGIGLSLYQAVGEGLPPPQSVSEEAVTVAGVVGRWSAESHVLEWVDGGVYRSITSPAFDLTTLLRVANSLQTVGTR